MTLTSTDRAILAQVAEINGPDFSGGPAYTVRIAEALGIDDDRAFSRRLGRLYGAGLLRLGPISPMGGPSYGITDAGRIEATGGPILTLDGTTERLPAAAQVALF